MCSAIADVIEKRVEVNDVGLAYFERREDLRGKGPTLFFVHATGFHGRLWDQIIARLPECHSIALDQRGHGRSDKVQIDHWRTTVNDAAAVIESLDLENVLAVGHSMGGHALIGASSRQQDRVSRLVAIDPVIAAEEDYIDEPIDLAIVAEHPMARRRSRYGSAEEMADHLATRGSYGLFDREILMDYCRYGLVPAADGVGLELACPPHIEASVYASARTNRSIYDAVRALRIPVQLLRARRVPAEEGRLDFSTSPTWPELAGLFADATDHYFEDRTHFLPMEIPDVVAGIVAQEFRQMKV